MDELNMKLQESEKQMGASSMSNAQLNLQLNQVMEQQMRLQGQVDLLSRQYETWNEENNLAIQRESERTTRMKELETMMKKTQEMIKEVTDALKELKKGSSKSKTTSSAPSDIPEEYQKGMYFFARGELDNALISLSNFYSKTPGSGYAPNALLHIGKILARQNKIKEAKEAYKQVMKEYPKSRRVPEAKKLLEKMK